MRWKRVPILVIGVLLILMLGACRNAPRNPIALTPVATPIPTAPPTSTILPSPTIPPTPTPIVVVHVVQAGDTLFALSAYYGTTVVSILEANPDLTPENLPIGRAIKVPKVP